MDFACSCVSEWILPTRKASYTPMVVSTAAGHWTNHLFPKVEPPGMEGILTLFEVAMSRWAEEVQRALRADARNRVSRFRLGLQKRNERRAVVWAYLPASGHHNFHDFRRRPWNEIPSQPANYNPWNLADISGFNSIFEVRSLALSLSLSLDLKIMFMLTIALSTYYLVLLETFAISQ